LVIAKSLRAKDIYGVNVLEKGRIKAFKEKNLLLFNVIIIILMPYTLKVIECPLNLDTLQPIVIKDEQFTEKIRVFNSI